MIIITSQEQCCGCTACASICPKQCVSMRVDEEGFLYPHADQTICIKCGLCEKVCPELNPYEPLEPAEVFAAINPDEEVRIQSSSGGIFSMLAQRVVDNKGVVFGATFDENWDVHHVKVDSMSGLRALRGSKYIQSRIEDTFIEAQKELLIGRQVLFSGTPCQISGLTHFLRKEYDNLLTVDVICHGAPSPFVWQGYLASLHIPETQEISSISFRDKTNGWLRFGLAVRGNINEETNIANNSTLLSDISGNNIFLQGFRKDLYLRPSCHKCPSKCGRSHSDISLGDLWGVDRINPEINDDKGISLVMLNSAKGKEAWEALDVKKYVISYEQALLGNYSICNSVKVPKFRELFWQLYKTENVAAIPIVLKKMEPKGLKKIAVWLINKFALR